MVGSGGKWRAAALLALLAILLSPNASAGADPAAEARALYQRFAAAQNDGDLAAVATVLLDSPSFLWVSDGMSIWGPTATLARMALFQQAEIWRVEPDLAAAVAVPLDDRTAFLHLPLTLAIGSRAEGVERVKFLVSVLCVETVHGWRIAALFTTGDKSP